MQVNNQPLFDFASLEAELDPECTAELAKSFLEDTGLILSNLSAAIAKRDQEAARSNAHKIKGCSRSINCQQLEHESSAAEDAALAGDFTLLQSRFATLEPVYKALCAELTAYLDKG